MKRLLVMGMMFATVIVPLLLARDPKPSRAFRKLPWIMLVITALWAILLNKLYFVL